LHIRIGCVHTLVRGGVLAAAQAYRAGLCLFTYYSTSSSVVGYASFRFRKYILKGIKRPKALQLGKQV
jgi:hypothetical protein